VTNIILLELFSFFVGKFGLLSVYETPRIYQSSGSNVSFKWWNEREQWGTWHKKNTNATHVSSCFAVNYKSNSIGARDSDFIKNRNDKKRILLLGDSFAEGWGLNESDTLQFGIEKLTGYEVYNFGSAGDFGPLQYWLVYDKLAKDYQSDEILILLYPANDFTDNDYTHWNSINKNLIAFSKEERYRPYFEVDTTSEIAQFNYFIPKNALKREYLGASGAGKVGTLFFENFWTGNLVKTIRTYQIKKKAIDALPTRSTYSGYFDATIEQQRAVIYFLSKIIKSSKVPVTVVSIPQREDFERIEKGADTTRVYWINELKKLDSLSEKLIFFDLSEYRSLPLEKMFLTCDVHWSANGSKWAAEIISSKIQLSKQ